jgi:polyisoprenoid-binding protein YceI
MNAKPLLPTIFAALVLAVALPSVVAAADAVQRAIDPSKSTVQFSVTHIWVEHVTGTVPIRSGSVTLAPDSTIPTSATATIDATKISTNEPDRDADLRSPDFFDTDKFPTWTFTSTKIAAHGANAFEMDGNLTIHGITQPEHLNVTVSGDAAHPTYHTTGQIDRHAFDMSTTRLDSTIGATVDVTLDITLK